MRLLTWNPGGRKDTGRSPGDQNTRFHSKVDCRFISALFCAISALLSGLLVSKYKEKEVNLQVGHRPLPLSLHLQTWLDFMLKKILLFQVRVQMKKGMSFTQREGDDDYALPKRDWRCLVSPGDFSNP